MDVALSLTSLICYNNPATLSDFSILTFMVINEKKSDKTDSSNYRSISICELYTKLYPATCCLG